MKRKIRKTDFLIGLLLTFSLGFITSCAGFFSRYSTDEPEDIPLLENGNVYVSFNVNEMFSRTVLPTVTLSQYTYKLEAKQSGVVKKTVSPYTLASKVELPLGIYDFTLTGSKNSKDIVSGNLSGIDLTSKSKNLTFSLKPLTGNKGSAEITLIIPQTGVSKVKSGISTSLTAEPVTETPVSSFTLSNGKYRRNFTYSNTLNSAVTQFAVFKVYDSKGGLVASRTESLLIVGGCTSSATIEITANDFHTYTPAITVTKNGEDWTNSGKEIVLVDKDGNKYVLTDTDTDGDGITDGVFTGDPIPEGDYEIHIQNSGDSTTEKDTNMTYNAETGTITNAGDNPANPNSVNFDSVILPDDGGIIYTPVETVPPSFVPGDLPNEILIPEGSTEDLEFTVEPKDPEDGYEIDDEGITINGDKIFDGNGDVIPGKDIDDELPGVQIKIPPEDILDPDGDGIKDKEMPKPQGIPAIVYKITLNPNGGKWSSDNSTGNKEISYTVEDEITLPSASEITNNNQILLGWKNNANPQLAPTNSVPKGSKGDCSFTAEWNVKADISITFSGDIRFTSNAGNKTISIIYPYGSDSDWTIKWYKSKKGENNGSYTDTNITAKTYDYSSYDSGEYSLLIVCTYKNAISYTTTIGITIS